GAWHRPRHVEGGRRCRRDGDRPIGGMGHRPGAVPLQEPQLPLRRVEGARPRKRRHRERASAISFRNVNSHHKDTKSTKKKVAFLLCALCVFVVKNAHSPRISLTFLVRSV